MIAGRHSPYRGSSDPRSAGGGGWAAAGVGPRRELGRGGGWAAAGLGGEEVAAEEAVGAVYLEPRDGGVRAGVGVQGLLG